MSISKFVNSEEKKILPTFPLLQIYLQRTMSEGWAKESRRAGVAEYVTKESRRAGAAEYVTKSKQSINLETLIINNYFVPLHFVV